MLYAFPMCGGIEYQGHKVYFPNPEARLPVLLRDGSVTWERWGWRDKSDPTFISGGWARHESVVVHKWKRWHPRPVIIPVEKFMEKDDAKVSHWFDVDPNMAIQGLLAESDSERRVYVVTEPPPAEFSWVHDRWPRLVRYRTH